MKCTEGISLNNVKDVYDGPEGNLWELIMGEQIHIGGFASSMDLAEKASIGKGMNGVDLCCCNGAGMRFLSRFRNVASMRGIDASKTVVERGQKRCEAEGFGSKISFIHDDVLTSALEDGSADFVWGEDAWCYVTDKAKLISEAARIVKPGGVIAFPDWIEGDAGLSAEEAERFLQFMKFPNIQDLNGYQGLLIESGCSMIHAEVTNRFAPSVDLYLDMLNKQLTYDALKIIGFDLEMMQAMGGEMVFMQGLAHENKITQGLFVAKKS